MRQTLISLCLHLIIGLVKSGISHIVFKFNNTFDHVLFSSNSFFPKSFTSKFLNWIDKFQELTTNLIKSFPFVL